MTITQIETDLLLCAKLSFSKPGFNQYEQIEEVMNKINHRLRKILNYETPHAVFFVDFEGDAA